MAKRILVIDDDQDILSILDIIFLEECYETIMHQSGTTVEHIKILDPDLILLDVRINGFPKTGAEICTEIKNEKELETIPVLLLSAEINVPELARSCHADGFVNKPFDIENLLATVKEFLS